MCLGHVYSQSAKMKLMWGSSSNITYAFGISKVEGSKCEG